MNDLLAKLTVEFAKYRMTFGNELELQNQIAEILTSAGIEFVREYILCKEDRPDFFIADCRLPIVDLGKQDRLKAELQTAGSGFAIEVKVGGSINAHLRQMQRYNRHPTVQGTILICTKPFGRMMPETLADKPVAAINVGGNRL